MLSHLTRLVTALVLLAATGCASQHPVLYRNDQYHRVGDDGADAAVDACESHAREIMNDETPAGQAARDAAKNAGVGAAAGAAGGAVWGAIGGGAASGAAGGAAGGAASGLVVWALGSLLDRKPPDPVYRALVERCLTEQGYDPIAWR